MMLLLSHTIDTKISHLLLRAFSSSCISASKYPEHNNYCRISNEILTPRLIIVRKIFTSPKSEFTSRIVTKAITTSLATTIKPITSIASFSRYCSRASNNLPSILPMNHYDGAGLQHNLTPKHNSINNNSNQRFIQTSSSNKSSKGSSIMAEKPFLPKRALVLRKFSRLEYEKLCHPNLTDEQLATNLSERGSVYESLRHHDQIQKACLQQIESVLAANDIEYMTVDRIGYTEDKIDWADVVITSGGDGTFLMAASKVTTRDKPVIGINSDPTKSVGHLCLPSHYSNNFDKVIDLLKRGKYQWQYKQRLRVTLVGEAADEDPRELNDIRYNLRGINQFLDQEDSQDQTLPVGGKSFFQHHHHPQAQSPDLSNCKNNPVTSTTPTLQAVSRATAASTEQLFRTVDGKIFKKIRQLKERALNEVFVGETLSARVSYYELSIDNNKLTKLKSSGLTVCTGTGSTSWYYNINKLTEQQIESIAKIINEVTKSSRVEVGNAGLIADITKQFNQTLTFSPAQPIMAYSIRDPVDYASAMTHSHRGYAKKVEVKSRMQNACLVLDGCQFYPFNDGSYALIEMYDEDALKTISADTDPEL